VEQPDVAVLRCGGGVAHVPSKKLDSGSAECRERRRGGAAGGGIESGGSSVGVRSITSLDRRFLSAYFVFCLGKHFQNRCFISSQDFDPAFSRATVTGGSADQIWSLLKKAGLQATTSNSSDGTNGSKVLWAGEVHCVTETSLDSTSCTLDPAAQLGSDTNPLDGADAQHMADILTSHGEPVGVAMIDSPTAARFLHAFDLYCLGKDFKNHCFISSQGIDPAFSRADILDPAATAVWQLLKKAGLPVHTSNNSDGTAGKAVIRGGTVRCVFDADSSTQHCAFDETGDD
jgi:hypothetical protein